jgi:ComEC/Rec2-related protein
MFIKIPFLFIYLVFLLSFTFFEGYEINKFISLILCTIIFFIFVLSLFKKKFVFTSLGLIVIVFTSIYYYNDSNNIYLDKLIKKEEFICNVKLDHKSYKVHLNDIIYRARSGSCMQMPISFSRDLEPKMFVFDSKVNIDNSEYLFKSILIEAVDSNNQKTSICFVKNFKKTKPISSFAREFIRSRDVRPHIRGFMSAFILGDKSDLTHKQKFAFMNSGTMHLFAVSGLHMGCLYLTFIGIFKIFGFRQIPSIAITMSLLFGYLFMINFSVSGTRAYIMLLSWALYRICGLRAKMINVLCIASVILLLVDPSNFFEVSFLLSFTVVLTILWALSEHKFRLNNSKVSWIIQVIIVNYASFWGSFLILLTYFCVVIPASLITNLILVPCVSFLMPITLFLLAVSSVIKHEYIFYYYGILVQYMIDFCLFISSLEGAFMVVEIFKSNHIIIYLYNISLLLLFSKIKSLIARLCFLPFLCFLLLIFLF